MIIMLSVGGLLTAGAAKYSIKTSSENSGVAIGTMLGEINKAVGTYTVNDYKRLVDGTGNLNPTIADLQAAGLLNANINPITPIGGTYAIQISREPVGCVAPNCNLTSRVWITQPVTNPDTGTIDIRKLGAATGAMGGDGGWSDNVNPGTVRGTGGWTRPNPTGGQAGILMAINGYGSSSFSKFVDRAGTQGMLADFQMGNNNIVGANTVNATKMVLPAGNSMTIGNSAFYGDGANSAIRQSGNMYFQRFDGSSASIAQVDSINAGGSVNAGRVVATASGGGNIGNAASSYYDIGAGRMAVANSLYSYNVICAGRANGDCSGGGGVSIHSNGDLAAAGNAVVNGSATIGQTFTNESYTNGYFRTQGDGGWYSSKWNGGLYMADGSWIRSYADKNIYSGGQMQAGSLQANSSLRVLGSSQIDGNQNVGSQTVYGQQVIGGSQVVYGNVNVSNAVTPGVIASDGAYCGGNAGAIGRDGNNNIYVCN